MSIIVCDRNIIMQASPIHKHVKKYVINPSLLFSFIIMFSFYTLKKKKKKKKNILIKMANPILIEEYPRNVGSISKNDFFSSSRFWIHLKSIGFVLISIQVSVSDMSLPTW